jgi:Fe-S cluster assembly ATP-binding protein
MEIAGVPVMTFVRAAMNAQRKARGEPEVSAPDFLKTSKETAVKLRIDPELLKRPLNVGFSGGEKKRLEIYQMLMLTPRFMILDETDSGLDINALKVVAEGVNTMRSPDRAMLIITHYQRLLDHVKPDQVHILSSGRIVKSGGPELAKKLEAQGYDGVVGEKDR